MNTDYYAKAEVFRIGLECRMCPGNTWNIESYRSHINHVRWNLANIVHSVVSYNPSLSLYTMPSLGQGAIPPFTITSSVSGCCCLVPSHWKVFPHKEKEHTGPYRSDTAFASTITRQEMCGSVSCDQRSPRAGSWPLWAWGWAWSLLPCSSPALRPLSLFKLTCTTYTYLADARAK